MPEQRRPAQPGRRPVQPQARVLQPRRRVATPKKRIAFVSDGHGLSGILKLVLEDAKKEADIIVFLGDMVGYGADPRGCAELVMQYCKGAVLGNHDKYLLQQLAAPEAFQSMAFGISNDTYATIIYALRQIYGDNTPIRDREQLTDDVKWTAEFIKRVRSPEYGAGLRRGIEKLVDANIPSVKHGPLLESKPVTYLSIHRLFPNQSWRFMGRERFVNGIGANIMGDRAKYLELLTKYDNYERGEKIVNYLKSLKVMAILREFGITIVHDNPVQPGKGHYVVLQKALEDEATAADFVSVPKYTAEKILEGYAFPEGVRLAVVAHSHLPPFECEKDRKIVIGDGSVMPRFSSKATYTICEVWEGGAYTINPRELDIPPDILAASERAMVRAGLPNRLEQYRTQLAQPVQPAEQGEE
jgi:predicted phosphodiesterase